MSTYAKMTKHPNTGKWKPAIWRDDYFGPHLYGVLFEDGTVADPVKQTLKTKEEVTEEEQKELHRLLFGDKERISGIKLYVDDIRRSPDSSWLEVRTVKEAIKILANFTVDEVSLDHDISHQVVVGDVSRPYLCEECFCSVAYFIAQMDEKPAVTIHTANPIGADEMTAILERGGITPEIKLSGLSNRLEKEA